MKMLPTSLISLSSKLDPQTIKWILVLVSLGLLVLGAGAPLGGGSSGTGG